MRPLRSLSLRQGATHQRLLSSASNTARKGIFFALFFVQDIPDRSEVFAREVKKHGLNAAFCGLAAPWGLYHTGCRAA